MSVDVGDHSDLLLGAQGPQPLICRRRHGDASSQAVCLELVVVDDSAHTTGVLLSGLVRGASQEKRTGFLVPATALAELGEQRGPLPAAKYDRNLWRGRHEVTAGRTAPRSADATCSR